MNRVPDKNPDDNTSYLKGLIGDHLPGFMKEIVSNRIGDSDLSHHEIVDLFPDYFTADKNVGSLEGGSLAVLTLIAMAYVHSDQVPTGLKAEIAEMGGSAAHEFSLIESIASHNSIDTIDERLEYVEIGDAFYDIAQHFLEDDSLAKHRLDVKRAFTPLQRDIVCGDITTTTIEEVIALLNDARSNTSVLHDRSGAIGLIGEIDTLKHFLVQYKKKGDHVALPSTVRGGDGHYYPANTHDIDVLRQKKDGAWTVLTPIEVKRAEITEKIRRRYTGSLLAHVSSDGSVTISGDHRHVSLG